VPAHDVDLVVDEQLELHGHGRSAAIDGGLRRPAYRLGLGLRLGHAAALTQ